MDIGICIEIQVQRKSAEAIARAGIREELPSEIIKSKLLVISNNLQEKYHNFSQEIGDILDIERIYLDALDKERALV